jgi:hypothetical protein
VKPRWRWAVLVALLAAGTLGGLHWQPWRAEVAATGVVPAPRDVSGLVLPLPSPPPPASASAAASGAKAPAVLGGATLFGTEIPPEGIDVCGVRHVPADELGRWAADPAQAEARAQAIGEQTERIANAGVARLAARMAAGNERQQVAGRLLMQDREGAALLAARSSDARAYQMALQACALGSDGAPSCARLDAQRWAELDPSDARPWLRLMEEARRRKDVAGADAALAEAAARPRLSRASGLLEVEAVAAAAAVPDAAELGQAMTAVFGMNALIGGWTDIPFRFCRDEVSGDTTRLTHCRKVVRRILAQATDIAEATIAQKLADIVGVPRAQQAYDSATLQAAQRHYGQRVMESIGADCKAVRRIAQLSEQRAAHGELAMAVALLPSR